MRHLTPEELVDLAEGTRDASSIDHLAGCERCQKDVDEARAMMAAAAAADVPEPSPLFWDHLSRRVLEAVAAERPASRWWRPLGLTWPASTAAVAVAIVAAMLIIRTNGLRTRPVSDGVPAPAVETAGGIDDPSLTLVAELASGMDWDAEFEAGLTTELGGADNVVTELNPGERRELGILLRQALAAQSK